jgi:TolB-like protein
MEYEVNGRVSNGSAFSFDNQREHRPVPSCIYPHNQGTDDKEAGGRRPPSLVYRMTPEEKPPVTMSAPKPTLPDKPSIAVLPFMNMSPDPHQEYFCDGLVEDLITDLSKVSGLCVIARNSTFFYKGKQVMVRQVSEELGVRYVLEGSVRRAGDQVRINCQLIDAATGGHLWSERYDGSMSDIFGLQDKINQKIVAALAVKLTEGERAMVSRKGIQSPAAYDEYLKGREYDSRRTKGDYVRAEACYKRAIELDPGQSLLHSALAGMYWAASNMGLHVELNILWWQARLLARSHIMKAMKTPSAGAHTGSPPKCPFTDASTMRRYRTSKRPWPSTPTILRSFPG